MSDGSGRSVPSPTRRSARTTSRSEGSGDTPAFWSLWSLGVAAVISGDFYGWNLGLDAGGFGGLLIATVVIAIMYYGLCYSIAEMSPALPHTGGAYSFARSAMGPWGGFITGLAENMEYVITPAVVVSGDGLPDARHHGGPCSTSPASRGGTACRHVDGPSSTSSSSRINIIGIEIDDAVHRGRSTSSRSGILAFFFISVLVSGEFDSSLWTNIPPEEGGIDRSCPKGIGGIFPAIPFAIWFFLAIEELPLAAEESMDPKRDIPRATLWGMTTLVITGALILFLNTGVGGGARAIGVSATPLFDGFKAVFGEGTSADLLGLFGLIGLIASFFTIIYAYGRNTFSLSRAGYFPQWLSVTHGERQDPARRADRRRRRRLRAGAC